LQLFPGKRIRRPLLNFVNSSSGPFFDHPSGELKPTPGYLEVERIQKEAQRIGEERGREKGTGQKRPGILDKSNVLP
jgi:hypothetical protein